MRAPFPRWSQSALRAALALVLILIVGTGAVATMYSHSNRHDGVGNQVTQPIPFSHLHHVQGLGLDCRYCHASVERAASAGMPSTATCLGCHREIWKNQALLDPLRESAAQNKNLVWFRLHDLPDYVYFNHGIHVNKGIGCVTCHGAVSRMASVTQQKPFFMRDCLECHQHPEKYLRPTSEIFNEQWRAENQEKLGEELKKIYRLQPLPNTNCNLCHR